MYTEASITMDGKPCLRGPNWMLPSFHLKKRSWFNNILRNMQGPLTV